MKRSISLGPMRIGLGPSSWSTAKEENNGVVCSWRIEAERGSMCCCLSWFTITRLHFIYLCCSDRTHETFQNPLVWYPQSSYLNLLPTDLVSYATWSSSHFSLGFLFFFFSDFFRSDCGLDSSWLWCFSPLFSYVLVLVIERGMALVLGKTFGCPYAIN